MQYFQLFNHRFRSFELHPLLKRTAVNVLNPVSFFVHNFIQGLHLKGTIPE